MWNHHSYVVHILWGVNRCPQDWPSSNEAKLAIDLNRIYKSLRNSEAETLSNKEKLDVSKSVFS